MTNTQTDNMIESGRPLKEIVPLFSDRIAAYQYFAGKMAKSFATPNSNCVECGRECDAPPVGFTWRANLHTTETIVLSFLFTILALFAAHLYSRWVVVEFTTFHRLCAQCQRRHRTRTIMVSFLRNVLFAALMLLLFLTVPVVVFLFAMPFIAPKAIWLPLVGAIIGIGLLIFVAQGFETCRKLLIPHSLRQVGRFPFYLFALRKTA
jgi:hypothetical protein